MKRLLGNGGYLSNGVHGKRTGARVNEQREGDDDDGLLGERTVET